MAKKQDRTGYCALYPSACGSGRPDRQRGLSDGEREHLPDNLKAEALTFCSWCKAVYGPGRRMRGKLIDGTNGTEFVPWKA